MSSREEIVIKMNKFDQLSKECQSMKFEEGWKKIWTEIFSLEKILVAIKKPVEEQDKKEPLLFLGTMEKEPCIFAFSDEEHFKSFEKHVIEDADERDLSMHEITVEEFLNSTQHLANQNIPHIMFNYGNEFGIHTLNREIYAMYNAFIKGEHLQEFRVEEGTMVQVAVPHDIEMMKQVIESIKMNYKGTINSVSPVVIRVGEQANLTLVIDYKAGLPNTIKTSVMQNLHKELSYSPLFQTQVHFTEEQKLVPPDLQSVLQVRF